MIGAGIYRYDKTFSNGTTQEFSFDFELTDGTAFPLADYALSYRVGEPDCGPVRTIDQTNGVSVSGARATFSLAASPLPCGNGGGYGGGPGAGGRGATPGVAGAPGVGVIIITYTPSP